MLDAGLVGALQLEEKSFGDNSPPTPTPQPQPKSVNQMLSDAFTPTVISTYFRTSWVFGPLHVYFHYELGLSSVFGDVKYNGNYYPVSARLRSLSLGVSYTIFNTGK